MSLAQQAKRRWRRKHYLAPSPPPPISPPSIRVIDAEKNENNNSIGNYVIYVIDYSVQMRRDSPCFCRI